MLLEHADWAGAVIGTVRAGPGADVHLETAFWILVLPWELLGISDRDQRLTRWGAWVLPRALARAWGSDFDSESI